MLLQSSIEKKLTDLGVTVNTRDSDTLVLHNVPVHGAYSKNKTNMLLKCAPGGIPTIVFVDQDLEYLGREPDLIRRFSGAYKHDGWTIISIEHGQGGLETVIDRALVVLGNEGLSSTCCSANGSNQSDERESLMSRFGNNLSATDKKGIAQLCIGRDAEIEDAASCIMHWGEGGRLALIAGASGVGKTNLLWELGRLFAHRGISVWRVDLAHLFSGTLFESERAELLNRLLAESIASPNQVVALEHLELAVLEVQHGGLALARALDDGALLAGTILPRERERLTRNPLSRRLSFINLVEMNIQGTLDILTVLRESIATHHRVEIDTACLSVCLSAAQRIPGCLPGKALTLLDNAAARARHAGAQVVGPDDLYYSASRIAGKLKETE